MGQGKKKLEHPASQNCWGLPCSLGGDAEVWPGNFSCKIKMPNHPQWPLPETLRGSGGLAGSKRPGLWASICVYLLWALGTLLIPLPPVFLPMWRLQCVCVYCCPLVVSSILHCSHDIQLGFIDWLVAVQVFPSSCSQKVSLTPGGVASHMCGVSFLQRPLLFKCLAWRYSHARM